MRADASHRPWPAPSRPWVMAQHWRDLLFAHWAIEPDALRGTLPPGLELDLHEGRAWVSVVPFLMTGIRLRFLPPIPTTSRTLELNVRTYVTDGHRPGVWFYSLEAERRLAVHVGRTRYDLPYHLADMSCRLEAGAFHYTSKRLGSAEPATFEGRYRPTGDAAPAAPGSLAHWLSERYALYAYSEERGLRRGEIHHAPWPLQPAEAHIETETISSASGLHLEGPPALCHFARHLAVRIWLPTPAGAPA